MLRYLRLFALVSLLAAAACDADPASPLDEGQWGAVGAAMMVSRSAVTLEFDCAHGRFAMMPVLDRDGRFSVDGFLTRESGPIRLDPPATELPAHYMGIRSGDRINLTFRLIGDGAVGGPIELRLGQTPRLRKCL
jgi:hypothetical protein